ncbi:MAG: tetratricopeptide repeat protein, partial [Chloroflexota bacterium]
VYSALDMHDAARSLFKEADAEARSVASIHDLIETRTQIAAEYAAEEKYIAARYSIEDGRAALETVEISRLVTNLRLVFGQVYGSGHNWEEAEACYRAALENSTLQPTTNANISALISLANLYLRQNRIEEAQQIANEARVALERSTNQTKKYALKNSPHYHQRAGGEIILTLARISEKKGNISQADGYFFQALELLKAGNDTELLSMAYFSYGEALLARGEAQRGAQYLKLAYEERSKGTT